MTLLPPHVAHTGRSGTDRGFRKRVLCLDTTVLDAALTGAAVARPTLADDLLRHRVHQVHASPHLNRHFTRLIGATPGRFRT